MMDIYCLLSSVIVIINKCYVRLSFDFSDCFAKIRVIIRKVAVSFKKCQDRSEAVFLFLGAADGKLTKI